MDDLLALLGANDLVGTRAYFVDAVGRHRFDNAVKSGTLTAIFPRVYSAPWDADTPEVQRRAALLSVGGDAAISHTTALETLDLPVPPADAIHVTAYQPRHPRGVPGRLIVHRTLLPLHARIRDGLPVVGTESALANAWPLLPAGSDRRAPVIEAVRRRLVSAPRLAGAAERMWWLEDGRSLRELCRLAAAGCESELELFGYTHVFDVDGLRDASRQLVIAVGRKSIRLDIAFVHELLNVELDGRAYHASAEQWERDIRRDLLLAKLGWQTIRLSHNRLTGDIQGCREDVLAVRAARARRAS